MKRNVGGLDRTIRVILGLALLSLIIFLPGNTRYWGLLGVIPLFTALIGFCPLYALLGIRTLHAKR